MFHEYNHGGLLGASAASIPLGVTAAVKELQSQLRNFAFNRNKLECDPSQYDGTMTLGTVMAVAHVGKALGTQVHPVVGAAVDVIGLIRKPIELIPYGEQVLDIILSPWIIDKVYDALLGIIRLIPGGGGVASSINNAMTAVKKGLSLAAAPIATLLAVVPAPPLHGLGAVESFSTYKSPRFYEPAVDGPLLGLAGLGGCPASKPTVGTCTADGKYIWAESHGMPGHWERLRQGQRCSSLDPSAQPKTSGFVSTCQSPAGCQPMFPPPKPGQVQPPQSVRDHRQWPKGKQIVTADWSATRTYSGRAPKDRLSTIDLKHWEKHKNEGQSSELSVARGAIAFLTFKGADGSRMGAFWSEVSEILTIKRVPDPDESRYPWDYVVDAVAAAANAVVDVASDAWNWIEANIGEIYSTIKEFGCAIINSDIVVAVAAAGTGLVASPAASAAVVSAAAQGRAACAALDVAELVYAILSFLAMDFPKPTPLTPSTDNGAIPTTGIPNHLLQLRADIIANMSLQTMTMATSADAITGCPSSPVDGKVLLPLTPPVVPLATTPIYPPGSIAAFDPSIQRFRIAKRVGVGLGALGQQQPADTTHAVVPQTAATLPTSTSLVSLTEFQKATGTLPIVKRPAFWVVIGVGVIAAGAGGYVLYRRRRRLTR